MKSVIKYNSFFAYSEDINKSFYTEFKDGVNIIYGKNTSGKSTLLQAINYTFGINDELHKLSEVLSENVIFRLDFQITQTFTEDIIIIRDLDFIYIIRKDKPLKKFSGISGNNSEEHRQLKKYLSDLLGFNIFLETKGEYKLGSIESAFLPYYVAQDYGWVLALKSFRGFDYFKNFKIDYYDYYLGINNEYDRTEKQRLEKEKSTYENEIRFLENTENTKDELQLSKLKDEKFINKSAEYLTCYKENKNNLIQYEKESLVISNQIKFIEERLKVLKIIKSSTKNQEPQKNDCPTCHQILLSSVEKIYEYHQDIDNTNEQIKEINSEIKKKTGRLNSLKKKINELRKLISKKYSIISNYEIDDLTVNTWIDNKANIALSNKIISQIGQLKINLQLTITDLSKFKTNEQLKQERNKKDIYFKKVFNDYLAELNVKDFKEDYSLYKMKLFPHQGVELLKTLLAYHFAFNVLIKQTSYVHRLPFVMDAIFKEDIDEGNRKIILDFINKYKPNDTQVIFSIAESKENIKTAQYYNNEHFNKTAQLIEINTTRERAFLSDFEFKDEAIKNETLELIE